MNISEDVFDSEAGVQTVLQGFFSYLSIDWLKKSHVIVSILQFHKYGSISAIVLVPEFKIPLPHLYWIKHFETGFL